MSARVNYGLWVIMMCQCRFNKCATLVGHAESGGSSMCVKARVKWELCNFLLNFSVNLKNVHLKSKMKP